jgi:hypothetical protein
MYLSKLEARAALALLVAVGSCNGSGPGPGGGTAGATARPGSPPSSVSPPIDVASVMRRIHFAYKASGDGFLGGHDTYSVAVRDGAISVRPVQPARRPSRATRAPGKPREGAPLVLRTVALGRGSDALTTNAAKASAGDDGALAISRGLATEIFRNRPEGVEQSWRFDHKPSESGDLLVRVRAEGLQPRASTREGLHFFDPRTGLGLRYGHGTWVDGAGRRSPVLARAEGRDIVLRVPAALVEASSYPAVLDPVISPEIGSDQPITVGPSDGQQDSPAVAFGGGEYLAVWTDSRGATQTLAATRIAPDGTVLDPTGFYVSLTAGGFPTVAFGGGNFFVVWLGYQGDTTEITGLIGSRVSTAGAVLDPGGLPLTTTDWRFAENRSSLAYDGTNFLLVWEQYHFESPWESQILASRLTTGGVRIDATPIVLATDNNGVQSPTVTFCGTSYVAAWQRSVQDQDPFSLNHEDLYVGRVGLNGTALDPGGVVLSNAHVDQSAPRAACVGTTALIVWEDSREAYNDPTGGTWNIMGARFANGSVLDPGGLYIAAALNNQRHPAIASNGTNFLVAWSDGRNYFEDDIYATRVSANGFVLDGPGFKVGNLETTQTSPVVASDGSGFLGVWADTHVNNWMPSGSWYPYTLVASRISGDGLVLDPSPTLISKGGQPQRYPRVGYNGSEYLIVWEEVRDADYDLFAARINADGVLLDPMGIDLGTGPGYDNVDDVTSDGTHFFVLWTKSSNTDVDLYMTHVANSGKVLLPSPVLVSNAPGYQYYGRAVFDGTNVFAIWIDDRAGTNANHLYGAHISPAGAVLDPDGIPILTTSVQRFWPALVRVTVPRDLVRGDGGRHLRHPRAEALGGGRAPRRCADRGDEPGRR